MIQDKIKDLKEVINTIEIEEDCIPHESLKFKRDQIISEIEQELLKLNDFDNWKEWENSLNL